MNFGRSIRVNRGAVLVLAICGLTFLYFYHGFVETSGFGLQKNANEINLRKLLIGAIQAAQKGGIEIVQVSKLEFLTKSKGKTKEGADDPVTDADSRSHCVMKNGLHRIFPKLEVISEEDKGALCGDTKPFNLDPTVLYESAVIPDEIVDIKDITVWIDPLDATQEYTEKLLSVRDNDGMRCYQRSSDYRSYSQSLQFADNLSMDRQGSLRGFT